MRHSFPRGGAQGIVRLGEAQIDSFNVIFERPREPRIPNQQKDGATTNGLAYPAIDAMEHTQAYMVPR